MAPNRGLLRRIVSSIVAGAMVLVVVPLGTVSASAVPASVARTAPFYASLRSQGLRGDATLINPHADIANVQWRRGVSAAMVKATAKRLGFTVETNTRLGWSQITAGPRSSAGELVTALRSAGLVLDARPTTWMRAAGTIPNDPLFPSQWALRNTGQDGGTAGADINVTDVWSRSTGSKDVIVAVVDEGVNWAHADLKNNMWINTAEIPNNGIDDDHDGYVDDVRGWDFVNGDNTVYDATDGDRHGTHVAGIIGAEGNNGIGISGVSQHVRIMPLKFLGPDGGSDFDGAAAIVYAVDHGATVINCSWGGSSGSGPLAQAVAYAASKGVVLVCAAGNSGTNTDAPGAEFFPASFDATNVISVAATDRTGALADFSNFGSGSVDIAAPGADVTSTMPAQDSGFFVDGLTWKTVYLPVQAEILEPASARDALISRSVSQLGESTETPVLVVDDSAAKETSETPGVRLKVYTDALASGGFPNVTTWVTDDRGTPTVAAMAGKIVVWFTGKDTAGWYGTPCLTDEEQAAIVDDLDAGGRVVLISGKAASDLSLSGSGGGSVPAPGSVPGGSVDLLRDYFGATYVDYQTWGNDFHGRASAALAGIDAYIPAAYMDPTASGNLWPTASDSVARTEAGFRATTVMNTGSYEPLSGTSMAAPQVTGAIGLLKACLPSAPAEELAARVLNTAAPSPKLKDKVITGGSLDVAAAFGSYPGRVTITAPKPDDRLHTGTSSTLRWKAAAGAAAGATYTAEVGVPYAAYANGFESGTLAGFAEPTSSASPWSATEATAAHTGSYSAMSGPLPPATPAPEMGDGWYTMSQSSMQTTVTIPEGGGEVSFYWRMSDPENWDVMGLVQSNSYGSFLVADGTISAGGWSATTFWLPEGQQPITWASLNSSTLPQDARLYVDDITVTAHAFSSLGTAGAGATSLAFTVPGTATDDAWFRVQSHLNGADSAWATVKGVTLASDAIPPAAPTALTLVPDADGNVAISWVNPAVPDYDHTLVLASNDHMPTGPDDASATVSYDGTGTVASFGPSLNGADVYVSAWAVDTSDNWSPAATAHTLAVDTTPPDAVRSLRSVDAIAGLPTLFWAGADSLGTAEATVLRRTDTTPTVGDLDALVVDSGAGAAVDLTLDPAATQAFYTVYLTDPSGNVSQPRSIAVTIDPTGVTGTISIESDDAVDEAALVQTSTVTVDAAVSNATSMRVWINDERDPDADWVPFRSQFPVELLPIQGPQTVNVEFRKDAASTPIRLSADAVLLLHDPLAPTGLTAVSRNTGVKLAWDVPKDPTIAGYRVYESLSSFGPWTPLVGPEGVPMTDSSFLAAGLTPALAHYFRVTGVDVLGNEGAASSVASAAAGPGVIRFAGSTRAGTAAMASVSRFSPYPKDPTMGTSIVIAPDSDYVQALAANSLAGSLNASVLVAGKTLPRETADEIRRLKVKNAYVVGTTRAIAPAVDAALKGLGIHVVRIAGSDAYDVAAKVARRLMAPGAMAPKDVRVFVVNGTSPSDMCALMPIAYSSHIPVLVVKATSVPAPVTALLSSVRVSGGTVVGGTLAVSDKVMRTVLKHGGAERVWGQRAVQTAANLATWAVGQGYATWDDVSIANGSGWTNNLSIGSATRGGVVLLSPATVMDPVNTAILREHAADIDTVRMFGPLSSLSASVQSKVRSAMAARTGPVANPFQPGPVDPGQGN